MALVDENMQARRSTWVTPDQEILSHIISSIILSNSNILLLSRKKYSSTSSFISAVARFISIMMERDNTIGERQTKL